MCFYFLGPVAPARRFAPDATDFVLPPPRAETSDPLLRPMPLDVIRRAHQVIRAAAAAAPSCDEVPQQVADALAEAPDLPPEFRATASEASVWIRGHPQPAKVGRHYRALEMAAPILPDTWSPIKTTLKRLLLETERWNEAAEKTGVEVERKPSPSAVAAVVDVARKAVNYYERELSAGDERLLDIFECAQHGHRALNELLLFLGPAPPSPGSPEPLRAAHVPVAAAAVRRNLDF